MLNLSMLNVYAKRIAQWISRYKLVDLDMEEAFGAPWQTLNEPVLYKEDKMTRDDKYKDTQIPYSLADNVPDKPTGAPPMPDVKPLRSELGTQKEQAEFALEFLKFSAMPMLLESLEVFNKYNKGNEIENACKITSRHLEKCAGDGE